MDKGSSRIPQFAKPAIPSAITVSKIDLLRSKRRSKSMVEIQRPQRMVPRQPVLMERTATTLNIDLSKSNSVTKPITKSLQNLPQTRKPFVARSIPNKAEPAKPPVKPASSKAPQKPLVAKPVQKPPPRQTVPRSTIKRPAPSTSDEPSKPKVSKPMKPAPYDFKARFLLLQEKHKSLDAKCKEAVEKCKNAESELQTLTEIKENYEKLLETHTALESQVGQLQIDSEELKQLRPKYEAVVQACKEHEKNICSFETEIKMYKEMEVQFNLFKSHYYESENKVRQLHNQVQDLKGNIRVFCRVRPSKQSEMDRVPVLIDFVDDATLEIRKSRESVSITGKPTDLKLEFAFDRVFPPEASQMEVFEDLSHLIQSALDGYDICVFAYGQTGSGKTYTMQGETSPEKSGMIPRAIKLLFAKVNEKTRLGWNFEVDCSFLEIYNENIRDLLNPDQRQNHDIKFNEGKGTTVTNLVVKKVSSSEILLSHMFTAQRNRAVAATNYNEHSSRSHFVTKITVRGVNEESKVVYNGSINLVDLAGSESAKTTSQERLTETKNINKSLSTLGNVMLALHNREKHVPYRNSKLTYLLQNCLGGNSKTLMFVNISPFEECYNESINSLRFGAKVKEVKLGSKRNRTYK